MATGRPAEQPPVQRTSEASVDEPARPEACRHPVLIGVSDHEAAEHEEVDREADTRTALPGEVDG